MRSPTMAAILFLFPVYIALRLSLPLLPIGNTPFTTIYLTSVITLVFIAGTFCAICSEWLIDSLSERDEQLAVIKQENSRLSMQLSQAQKLESLGMRSGGIAHDFNNMLTSILGYTSLAIKKLPVDSEVRKDLHMVMSGARQAVDLTSQMLLYAGKGAIEFESVDLSEVVDNIAGLVNSIVPKKIRLSQKIPRDLPAVKGDAIQFGQVVMNLVANSVDAIKNQDGTIEISTAYRISMVISYANVFFLRSMNRALMSI